MVVASMVASGLCRIVPNFLFYARLHASSKMLPAAEQVGDLSGIKPKDLSKEGIEKGSSAARPRFH